MLKFFISCISILLTWFSLPTGNNCCSFDGWASLIYGSPLEFSFKNSKSITSERIFEGGSYCDFYDCSDNLRRMNDTGDFVLIRERAILKIEWPVFFHEAEWRCISSWAETKNFRAALKHQVTRNFYNASATDIFCRGFSSVRNYSFKIAESNPWFGLYQREKINA